MQIGKVIELDMKIIDYFILRLTVLHNSRKLVYFFMVSEIIFPVVPSVRSFDSEHEKRETVCASFMNTYCSEEIFAFKIYGSSGISGFDNSILMIHILLCSGVQRKRISSHNTIVVSRYTHVVNNE